MDDSTRTSIYESPSLRVIGELRTLTLGGPHSCHDGNSPGNTASGDGVGNIGKGNCDGISAGSG